MTQTILLNTAAIKAKLKRMAIEIAENNFNEKEIVLLGIIDRGVFIAEYLMNELKQENGLQIYIGTIQLNKQEPLKNTIELKCDVALENKTVIVIDDVANSGKTLLYALKPLMEKDLKKLQVAVLVDRQHKRFPITPDFIGISVSTTLQEMIYVKIGKEVSEPVAYLS